MFALLLLLLLDQFMMGLPYKPGAARTVALMGPTELRGYVLE